MAADAWLFECANKGGREPVLRLYAWDRPSITIGYHQEFARSVIEDKLGSTPVVRRITGGRALLHDAGELTYSVSGNFILNHELGTSLRDSYHHIASAIVAFYRLIGWSAEINHRDNPVSLGKGSSVQKGCFAAVSHSEVLIDGQKMAASSQRRAKSSLIQHGAIKLGKPANHPAIVGLEVRDTSQLLATNIDSDELKQKVISAFESVFGITLKELPFSDAEINKIQSLQSDFVNFNKG